MTGYIKPIETIYRGYRFRSRLEARWAVFFDALGLDWEYEAQGYELPSGARYLPDFLVRTPQGASITYEVKPIGSHECKKFNEYKISQENAWFDRVSNDFTPRSVMLLGDPMKNIEHPICPRCGGINIIDWHDTYSGELSFSCIPCDMETPSGGYHDPEIGVLGINVWQHKGILIVDPEDYRQINIKYIQAAQQARAARFEYGEAP